MCLGVKWDVCVCDRIYTYINILEKTHTNLVQSSPYINRAVLNHLIHCLTYGDCEVWIGELGEWGEAWMRREKKVKEKKNGCFKEENMVEYPPSTSGLLPLIPLPWSSC